MRLSLFLLSIVVSFSFIALAEHFELPQGRYSFNSAQVYSLKHILLFDSRSSADRERIDMLKEKSYLCKRYPNHKIQCHKFVDTNNTDLEIPSDELKSLTPFFGESSTVSLITEADLVSTYEIEQEVISERGEADLYKLYLNHDSGIKRLDVQLGDKKYRFNYTDQNQLSHLLFKKKKINKKERHEISYLIEFNKDTEEN